MIYLCTANLANKIQHNFYCCKTKNFYGVEIRDGINYLIYSVDDIGYITTKPIKYVLPDILNIVEYKNLSERLDIVNNSLDKLIFENI